MSLSYNWEYTDIFGGEANYSWVRRGVVTVSERRSDTEPMRNVELRLARAMKRAAGLSGVRGVSYWQGGNYEFRPYNSCTVLFGSYKDN